MERELNEWDIKEQQEAVEVVRAFSAMVNHSGRTASESVC